MEEVKVTDLRNNMLLYLSRIKKGEELLLTSRGKAIARLTPVEDTSRCAREQLVLLREKCRIGDVVSPLGEKWEVSS